MRNELNPCPVCGGKAHLRTVSDTTGWEPEEDYSFVMCNGECGSKIRTLIFVGKYRESKAIAAWNSGEIEVEK